MQKLFTLTTVLSLAVMVGLAKSSVAQNESPKSVLEHFCEIDAQGKLLRVEDLKEVAAWYFSPRTGPVDNSIEIVKDYVVSDPHLDGNRAVFKVNYLQWGELDSSLRFIRFEGRVPNAPVNSSGSFGLVLTDKQMEIGQDGKTREASIPLGWRIAESRPASHITVDTAIRYVTEMRDKASDATIKENADKTIAELKRLLVAPPEQGANAQAETPWQVVKRYCELESEGQGLTFEGRQKLASLFVQPTTPHGSTIFVVHSFNVRDATVVGDTADAIVDSIHLGSIDASLHFTDNGILEGKVCCGSQEPFTLVLSDRHSGTASAGGSSQELPGTVAWRIVDSDQHADVWITLDAAIRYVTQARDKSTNPHVKRNANATIATLQKLKKVSFPLQSTPE